MAWNLVAQLGLLALSVGLQRLLTPKPKAERAASLAEFDFPRANEGDPIPVVYGTVRVRSPIVISIGSLICTPNDDPPTLFTYSLGLRLLLCRGNAAVGDPTGGAELVKVYEGDVEVTLVANPVNGPETPAGSFCNMYLAATPGPGGGQTTTFGYLGFYRGLWLQTRIPDDVMTGENLAELPSYRGQVVVRLFDWNLATATTIPAYSYVIYNPVTLPGYGNVSGPIGNGEANPAAVIYDLLANPWGGVANGAALIDVESFAAAAATLQDEQHGCSWIINTATEARNAIDQILRQIDGVLYEDPATRRYVLKLIREDYDVEDLIEFDQSNVVGDPEMPTTLWDEAVNEVRVIYTNPVSGYQEGVAIAQDLALISAQGGRRRSTEIRFAGVQRIQLAAELAQRELNLLSRPLARLRISVNRAGFDLRPGDPFVFTWADWNGFTGVFRVMEIDPGTLTDGRVTITAVQDRFAIAGVGFPPDDEIGEPIPTPDPIELRLITEAPRWIQQKAYDAGTLVNVDAQRGYYLARPEGEDSRFKVVSSADAGSETADSPARPFPAGFTVDLAYARTTSPWDVTTGLRIRGLYGTSLAIATEAQIASEGRNLIYVNGEILAFENFTDLGGGDYLLEDVWRGCLDTVPANHAEGDQGYFLPGSYATGALGGLVHVYGSDIVTHTQAAAGSTWTPSDDSPEDSFTARSRTMLSYPPANLQLASSKVPSAVLEGGLAISFATRDRLQLAITKPDASAETPEAGTVYDAVAVKGDAVAPGGETILALEHTSSTTTQVHLGAAGHGLLDVGARARRATALPDGSSPQLVNWQTPLLSVQAHHYRNLLINPRFTSTLAGWTTISGTPSVITNSTGLGAGGSYVTGSTASVEIRQDIPIAGYLPANYRAILDFSTVNTGDTGDTITVELISLDIGGSALQTETYGPLDPGTTWGKNTLTIDDLDDDTYSIRVRIVLSAVGEFDTTASVGCTELCLRVGQVTDQLLTNPSFEAGVGVGWTATSGTWQLLGATPYDSTNYVRPNDGASAQLQQTVSLTTGYELGVAVLVGGRMNDAADDTGEILMEALASGGSVLASVTSGVEAISPSNVWQRRQIVLELPATTVDVRITLNATRVTGTPLNSCFDGFDLRLHKHLDPDVETSYAFEERIEQPLPRSTMEWKFLYAGVANQPPPPNYALFDGGVMGRLGVEPLMQADDGITTDGRFIATTPRGDVSTCYDNPDRTSRDVHTSPIGQSFGNFSSSMPFTAFVFFKVNELPWSGVESGLFGRVVDGLGWSVVINTDGVAEFALFGADATVTAVGATINTDGGLHGIGVIFDPIAEEIHLVEDGGVVTVSTTTAGEFQATEPGRFRIFRAAEADDPFPGQIARLYVWREALTTAQVQAIVRYQTAPSDWAGVTTAGRTGSIACIVGEDSTGPLVEIVGPGRIAQAFHESSGRTAIVAMPNIPNLAPSHFTVPSGFSATWGSSPSATVAFNVVADPTGHKQAASITGDNTQSLDLADLALGAAGTRHVWWYARGDSSFTAKIDLYDQDIDVLDVTTTFDVTAAWQLFRWAAAWTGGTGGIAMLRVRASNSGTERTIYLSPIMLVTDDAVAPWPGTIPLGEPGPTCPTIAIAPGSQFNREGEVEIECALVGVDSTLVHVDNGTNNNDRRTITWNDTAGVGDIESAHYNASATADTGAELAATTIDEAEPFTARLRWNRAGLVDGISTSWTALRAEQGATVEQDGGRAATFTASTTQVTSLDLGHQGEASVMAGLIFAARIAARERKF